MWRAIFIFAGIALLSAGLAWFADRPGTVTLTWLGYEIETSFFFATAVVALLMVIMLVVWSFFWRIVGVPGSIFGFFRQRRRQRGYDALSQGMIALGAGDAVSAAKFSGQSDKLIGSEPLALLLKAQAAQINGDEKTAARIFRAMLQSRETELLGLHGLFVQARRESDRDSARTYAERAMRLKPELPWAARAVLSLQSADGDWRGAERTLTLGREYKLIDKKDAARQQAVLLTAQALEAEENDLEAALVLALDAHKQAPDLVPASVIAGRILASQGNTRKAAKVLEKTWKLSPHPDIAEVYGAARPGDSPRDRLKRVRLLVQKRPDEVEGPVAIARAAMEAREWDQARTALKPLLDDRPPSRVCMIMAEIENDEHGDKGRVREWLARAVNAPRDPMWTADGYATETWAPVSPISGRLDAFEWKVPVQGVAFHGAAEMFEAPEEMPTVIAEPDVPSEDPAPESDLSPLETVDPVEEPVTIDVVAEAVEQPVEQTVEEEAPAPAPVGVEAEAKAEAAPEATEPEPVAEAPAALETKTEAPEEKKTEEDVAKNSRSKKSVKLADVTDGKGKGVDEPIIFVPPRAPDDPGPDGDLEPDENRSV